MEKIKRISYKVLLSGGREQLFVYHPLDSFSDIVKDSRGVVRLFANYSEETVEKLLFLQTTPEVKVGHVVLYGIRASDLENLFGILSVLQKLTLTLIPSNKEEYKHFYSSLYEFLFSDPVAFCYITWLGHLIFAYDIDVEGVTLTAEDEDKEEGIFLRRRLGKVRSKKCMKCPLLEKGCSPWVLATEIFFPLPDIIERFGFEGEMEEFCEIHKKYALEAGKMIKDFLEGEDLQANILERKKANVKGLFWIDPLNVFRKVNIEEVANNS